MNDTPTIGQYNRRMNDDSGKTLSQVCVFYQHKLLFDGEELRNICPDHQFVFPWAPMDGWLIEV